MAAAFAFVGFGLSDVSHDCLLTPGRALLSDMVAETDRRGTADAVFTGMQMLGRFVALGLGVFPLERLWAPAAEAEAAGALSEKAPPITSVVRHLQAILTISGALLLLSALLSMCCARDFVAAASAGASPGGSAGAAAAPGATSKYRSLTESESSSAAAAEEEEREEPTVFWGGASLCGRVAALLRKRHRGLSVLLCGHLCGWVSIMSMCFYWTSWVGERRVGGQGGGLLRVAYLGLAAGALVSTCTTLSFNWLHARVSMAHVYLCGEVSFGLCMVATPWVPAAEECWWASVVLGAGMGFGYATHANNAYAMCETMLDEGGGQNGPRGNSNSGLANGLINATLALGQILVGGLAGLVVERTGGYTALFCGTGAIVVVVNATVLLGLRCRWFTM